MGPTTTTKKKKMANSEKKINALDIVSARSLGSLASVEGMFKGKKQQLTSYATFAIIVGSVAGLLFGFDQNLLNQVLNEPDFREAMSMPQAVDACGPGGEGAHVGRKQARAHPVPLRDRLRLRLS